VRLLRGRASVDGLYVGGILVHACAHHCRQHYYALQPQPHEQPWAVLASFSIRIIMIIVGINAIDPAPRAPPEWEHRLIITNGVCIFAHGSTSTCKTCEGVYSDWAALHTAYINLMRCVQHPSSV
jgi:hypothetical protein